MRHNKIVRVCALAALVMAVSICCLGIGTAQAALVLKLEAANYDPLSGTWSDTSGSGNHALQATGANRPSLVANRTANGLATVRFDGANDFFSLTSSIAPISAADGYTVFAYVRPEAASAGRTIVSGTQDSAQYRIVAGPSQQTLETYIGDPSTGTAILPEGETADFSNINVRINNAVVTDGFRYNGAPDGNTVSNTFTQPIDGVGKNFRGNNEWFAGDIAEIRIYNEQLSLTQIQAIEAEMATAYTAPTGQVSLPVILNPTFDTGANFFTQTPGYVAPTSPSNPTEIPNWTGTGDRGVNPGNGAGAPFRNNGNNAGQVAFIQREGSLSQDISGFEVGKEYRIAFDYNARTGSDPAMTATIGSASLTDASIPEVGGSNSYYAGNLVFTPASATETLAITSTSVSGDPDRTLLLDNFRVFRNGPSIADGGFEDATLADGQFAQGGTVTGSPWTITGTAGVTRNISGFQSGNIRAPEGDQHGLIQATGAFSQTITGFEVGAEYSFSLLTMARQYASSGNDLEVLLDAGLGSEMMLIDLDEVTFSSFTELESALFVADKDSYELTIRSTLDGGDLTGDRTTFFDNAWFNQWTEAPEISAVPEPSTFVLAALGLLGLGFFGWRKRK